MFFTSTLQFAQHWSQTFHENLQESIIQLKYTQESLSFELLSLSDDSSPLAAYARDALHYACVAELRDHAFWEFLFNDTYNLQSLFALDQVDIITVILLILERMNHYGFAFPKICYDMDAARTSLGMMTPETMEMLKYANFEEYCFEVSPLLEVPDAL